MTVEFLRHLAKQSLPCQVHTPSEINMLSVLRAAGLVMAFIPSTEVIRHGATGSKAATMLAITDKGRLALRVPADTPGL
ncbi:hypothetical protein NU688_18605 [Variovorax sp. ZS18.2.2]|uniref:hypothetical protein n=1 Tax=Variovorax sp. ZS18.2.2 TaxID=2971255 RepID=UPI0021518C57|nr:hypothetical protein [Variovorax sp. ZS18.2.2]MCR6478179.1 hypothetical protein [Variovorax sp. ZS18.2.2]